MSLHYTPGQLRIAIGISQETYRHWKKALGPLRRDVGRNPCFTAGDLLSVAIVKVLTVDLAIRVRAIAALCDALFDVCNSAPWLVLERSKLLVDLKNNKLQLRPELELDLVESPTCLIPLRSVVIQLRESLLAASRESNQEALRFPPTPLPVASETALSRGRP